MTLIYQIFFKVFEIPKPDYSLNVGGESNHVHFRTRKKIQIRGDRMEKLRSKL